METKGRPNLPVEDINVVLTEMCRWKVKQIDRLDSFQDSNFMVRYETSNVSQLNVDQRAIVKIIHSHNFCESKMEREREVMEYLTTEGFICTTCLQFPDEKGFHITDDGKFVIRMFSFVPGVTLKSCLQLVDNRCLLRELGSFIGKLHKTLQAVSEKIVVAARPNDPWILQNHSTLYTLIKDLEDIPREKENLITEILHKFENTVMTSYEELKKGVIHNDIHDLNIIVNYKDGKLHKLGCNARVNDVRAKYGLIDFNDIACSPYLFEVAMVIRDLMVDMEDIPNFEIGAHFLAGYKEECPISEEELWLLPCCIQVGLCQYIIVGESEFQKQPDNEYTRAGADGAWTMLQILQQSTNANILKSWKEVIDF